MSIRVDFLSKFRSKVGLKRSRSFRKTNSQETALPILLFPESCPSFLYGTAASVQYCGKSAATASFFAPHFDHGLSIFQCQHLATNLRVQTYGRCGESWNGPPRSLNKKVWNRRVSNPNCSLHTRGNASEFGSILISMQNSLTRNERKCANPCNAAPNANRWPISLAHGSSTVAASKSARVC